jgi:hypothetical protein
MGEVITFTNRPGVRVTVDIDGDTRRVWNTYSIPHKQLDAFKAQRNQNRRAPLGDSDGAWVKCAEIPLSLLLQKIPPDAWGDEKALAKLLDDPEWRAFRTDGEHRRF